MTGLFAMQIKIFKTSVVTHFEKFFLGIPKGKGWRIPIEVTGYGSLMPKFFIPKTLDEIPIDETLKVLPAPLIPSSLISGKSKVSFKSLSILPN